MNNLKKDRKKMTLSLAQFEKEFRKDPKYEAELHKFDLGFMVSMAITDLRIELGLTQAKLARKCGMKQSAIARLESGYKPAIKTLERIAAATDRKITLRFEK